MLRRDEPPVLVWSDAMYEHDAATPAGGGFVVLVPERAPENPLGIRWRYRVIWGAESTDPTFLASFVQGKRQYIGPLELAYGVAPYMSIPEELRDKEVIHFLDNTGAVAGLVKGYARAVDSGVVVNAFHAWNAGLQADVYFEYVRSKANIADMPSRLAIGEMFAALDRLGLAADTRRVDIVLPDTRGWRASAASWLRRAAAPPSVTLAELAEPRPSPVLTVGDRPPRGAAVVRIGSATPLADPFHAGTNARTDRRRDRRAAFVLVLRRLGREDVRRIAERRGLHYRANLATPEAAAAREAALQRLVRAFDAGMSIHIMASGGAEVDRANDIKACVAAHSERHPPSAPRTATGKRPRE